MPRNAFFAFSMLHCIDDMRCISSTIKYIYVYRHSYTGADPEFFSNGGRGDDEVKRGEGIVKIL